MWNSLSCASFYTQHSFNALNLKLEFISWQDCFQSATVKFSPNLVFGLVSSPESGFKTDTRPLRPVVNSLLLTDLLLIGVLHHSSVMTMLFYLSGNYALYTDLMVGSFSVCLILLWMQLIQFLQSILKFHALPSRNCYSSHDLELRKALFA